MITKNKNKFAKLYCENTRDKLNNTKMMLYEMLSDGLTSVNMTINNKTKNNSANSCLITPVTKI